MKRDGAPSHRAISALALVVFLFSAAVQINDPDPAIWLAVYGYTAGLAAVSLRGQVPIAVAVGSSLVFAAGAATRLSALTGATATSFDAWAMGSESDEEAREAVGLLLCCMWCVWLAVRARVNRTH